MADMDTPTERRSQLALRAVFQAAMDSILPFFDNNTQWGGQSHEVLAYRTLREEFPELSTQDHFIIVSTAKRMLSHGPRPVAR